MNALELANEIEKGGKDGFYQDEMVAILRQQAKEIEQFRFVLRNLTLATSKKIGDLEEELENCTCQGGHSEAYLKVKGRLPKQSLVEDLNDMHIAKSILRAENHFKFGEKK
jgi:hypothetical protein